MAPTAALLAWYGRNARRFAWRGRRRPYAIWVSEIMLQQTRAATVGPYYRRWMRRFPSLRSLSDAPRREVLRLWEGLGYYRRAHHLHQAAREIVRRFRGRLPREERDLRSLPGIGAYTAAALAAIAFGENRLALDANVRRVLTRLLDLPAGPRSPAADRRLEDKAASLVPNGRAGEFNQALMDLGSAICTARRPRCPDCPLARHCLSFRRGRLVRQAHAPVQRARPLRLRTALVVWRAGRVLIARRPEAGLLGGLWEFPSAAGRGRKALARGLDRALPNRKGRCRPQELLRVRHQYTHFEERVTACEVRAGQADSGRAGAPYQWVRVSALGRYPMGRVDRQIADALRRQARK